MQVTFIQDSVYADNIIFVIVAVIGIAKMVNNICADYEAHWDIRSNSFRSQ